MAFLSFVCCVLSSRGLWDGPIPRPEEPCRVRWCHCIIRSNTYNGWAEEVRIWMREREKKERVSTTVLQMKYNQKQISHHHISLFIRCWM
jgi:hypothetical protein